jgi:hypothetical protein
MTQRRRRLHPWLRARQGSRLLLLLLLLLR